MDKSVFLDTSYTIALSNKDDKYCKRASEISKEIISNRINIVTTELVLIEIADSLAKTKYRNRCIYTMHDIRGMAYVIQLGNSRNSKAWSLYEKMTDKEWGLTDCFSFIVMKEFDIKQALTTDKHFDQAGFERLLK